MKNEKKGNMWKRGEMGQRGKIERGKKGNGQISREKEERSGRRGGGSKKGRKGSKMIKDINTGK